jgi:hypothetical protein
MAMASSPSTGKNLAAVLLIDRLSLPGTEL